MSNQTNTHLHNVAEADILASIEKLQGIQKRHRPDSEEWLNANETLQPLFAEMARRKGAAS